MSIEFEDNRVRVKQALFDAGEAFLHEAAGELQARTRRNSRVDTGQTKGSYEYKIDAGAEEQTCQIGSNLENAIGKNLELVNMHCTVTVEKVVGYIKHQKGSFITPKVKHQTDRCTMLLPR